MPVTASNPLKTRTALVWCTEEGFVIVRILPDSVQALQDAQSNIAAAISASEMRKCPLLVDIREARMLEPEARHYYAHHSLEDSFTALALLIHASPLGIMMGNVYSKVARHKVPLKLFQNETDAHKWLTKHT